MPASRLIILGVAVAAAGGAGYVAKNMVVAPSPRVVVDAPKQPGIALQDVLVLSGDVAMGSQRDNGSRDTGVAESRMFAAANLERISNSTVPMLY